MEDDLSAVRTAVERALSIAEGILDFHVTAVEVWQVHDSVGMPR
jgi:hypothetical protein